MRRRAPFIARVYLAGGGSATLATMIIRALQPKRLGRIDEDVIGEINKINKMSLGGPP